MGGRFVFTLEGDNLGEVITSGFRAFAEIFATIRRGTVKQKKSPKIGGSQMERNEEEQYDFRDDVIKVLQAEQLIDLVKASSDGVGCDACTILCKEVMEKMAEVRARIEVYNAPNE